MDAPSTLPLHVLELPRAWLALLFQHVASGPWGLANAAALAQTCKFLHNLSKGSAVMYSDLSLTAAISSPDHPIWQWLENRSGRIAGLNLNINASMYQVNTQQVSEWLQRLQTLSGIPGVQLRVA
jgi:hypothetical protein